jgi:P4 family phage/plasmid primase-like protien
MTYALDTIPAVLRELDQWLLWREEEREDDPTKVPRQPDGNYASSTDPYTWRSFEVVQQAYQEGNFDGLGFVFTEDDDFVGVDLDDCVQDGSLTRGALGVVEQLDSYTEGSPSGTGLHIILKGFLTHDRNRTGDLDGMKEIEIYEDGRYFTFTGRHLDGTPEEPQQRARQLHALCEEIFGEAGETEETSSPSDPVDLDDRELIEKAKTADDQGKFERLWSGDMSAYESHSEADLALVNKLAYWTGGDRARIDQLFRQSALCRDKWTDRPDYRRRTIDKALEGRTDFYDPSNSPDLGPSINGHTEETTAEGDPWSKIRAAYEADDKKGARKWAAEQLINELGIVTQEESGRLYAYNHNAHVHEDGGEQAVEQRLVEELGRHHSRHEQKEVKAKAQALTYQKSFGDVELIPVANGDLDVTTLELKDPTSDRVFFSRSPAAWDPEAECPYFKGHLRGVVPAERERETLQEYAGYALMHWDIPFHKALFIVGPTASGKSTTLHVIRQLLGSVSSVSPQQLVNGRFGPIELEGAWANIRSDISAALLKDIGLFKELVGGDPIYVERKYEQGYTMRPTAKHMYSANRLPDVSIDDDAFYRRILLVSFPRTIPREDRVNRSDLEDQLESELDGILRWAVEGLQRVLDNNGFTHDLEPADARRKWEEHSSSIGRFKASVLKITGESDDVAAKQDVYTAYTQFCQDQGLSTETQQELTRTLKRDPRIMDAKRTPSGWDTQTRCYVGMQIRNDSGNGPESAF